MQCEAVASHSVLIPSTTCEKKGERMLSWSDRNSTATDRAFERPMVFSLASKYPISRAAAIILSRVDSAILRDESPDSTLETVEMLVEQLLAMSERRTLPAMQIFSSVFPFINRITPVFSAVKRILRPIFWIALNL